MYGSARKVGSYCSPYISVIYKSLYKSNEKYWTGGGDKRACTHVHSIHDMVSISFNFVFVLYFYCYSYTKCYACIFWLTHFRLQCVLWSGSTNKIHARLHVYATYLFNHTLEAFCNRLWMTNIPYKNVLPIWNLTDQLIFSFNDQPTSRETRHFLCVAMFKSLL